jgi:prevent-host-death family protein
MPTKHMTQLIDACAARVRFGEVMDKIGKDQTRFLVSRRGKPAVVILGVDDYLKNIIKQPELLTTIQLSAQEAGLNEMTEEEIQAEIEDYRKDKGNL